MSDKSVAKKSGFAQRVGLRKHFDDLDALIDLSNPAVFAARRELGKAVGRVIDNAWVTSKTWPPYGERGALQEPPDKWPPPSSEGRDA